MNKNTHTHARFLTHKSGILLLKNVPISLRGFYQAVYRGQLSMAAIRTDFLIAQSRSGPSGSVTYQLTSLPHPSPAFPRGRMVLLQSQPLLTATWPLLSHTQCLGFCLQGYFSAPAESLQTPCSIFWCADSSQKLCGHIWKYNLGLQPAVKGLSGMGASV